MTPIFDALKRARTMLYVPGYRPDRFAKAQQSGADYVALDLEDAVSPDLKETARKHVHDWLSTGGRAAVRINGTGTPWHEEDMAMLDGLPCAVILPKAETAAQVAGVLDRLAAGSCVLPLIETAAGVFSVPEVCSVRGVVRAIFGSADLGSQLGVPHTDWPALSYARAQVVLGSAAGGAAPPLDGSCFSIDDERKLLADTKQAAALGFTGKSCVHPRQVPVVRAVFTPSVDDLRWAREVVLADNIGGALVLDGQVVAKPMIAHARRVLSRAESLVS